MTKNLNINVEDEKIKLEVSSDDEILTVALFHNMRIRYKSVQTIPAEVDVEVTVE